MRVQQMVDAWRSSIPSMVEAYLTLKMTGPLDSDNNPHAWAVQVVGFDECTTRLFVHSENIQSANATLILHGYIGASPQKASRAFPIRLFEIYRQIHRVCPRYTIETLTTTLTNLHEGPRLKSLSEQLSNAYDAYLQILLHIDARVDTALGRDGQWHANNVCAPCLYKTMAEPPLKFSFLGCMDRNNSLKLIDSTFRAGMVRPDDRASASFHHLTTEQVDVFKDEVTNSQKVIEENSIEELGKAINTCARKKMFALFAISGIFFGGVMKYPLAIVNYLLDTYGADLGLGYDIMCAFWKTLSRSSLGAKVTGMRLRGVVPTFHGHAHNRMCQLSWHPVFVDGVGLEDFEECERTFAKSNNLATCTRFATPFHRQQKIDEHFYFHDQDEHAASERFIFNNYRQVLEKISLDSGQLHLIEQSLGTTAGDYEQYYRAEVKYFEDLRSGPEHFEQTAEYMDMLLKLHIFRYRTTFAKFQATEEALCIFEDEYRIETRWTTDSKEYKDALVLMGERKYRSALTELERLVVARLLELTKLGMGGVGYKLRVKISKALKTHAEAIRRALKAYNEAAAALPTAREQLLWADVMNKTSLAEFDLLRDTRGDVRRQPWAQPAQREAMVLHFGIKRAKEEIRRLNVEICRLITFMLDQHVDYYRAIASHLIIDPPLAVELASRWRHSSQISASICRQLVKTGRLVGFSDSGTDVPSPAWLVRILGIEQTHVVYEEPNEGEDGASDHEDLVVRELDVDEDSVGELMNHLSTFDDS
ncbi:hypothetical protein B0H14DRAFT_3110028 [Mycena olivaceomarginata]|nr:hypothetical protein B0H14DRAFT_3110028 [Mycena olivaceomarginata]